MVDTHLRDVRIFSIAYISTIANIVCMYDGCLRDQSAYAIQPIREYFIQYAVGLQF